MLKQFVIVSLASLVCGCAFACFVEVPSSVATVGAGGAGGSAGSGGNPTGGAGGCADGEADCDGDGTCETDIANDADNCGECGRSCIAAGCVDTRCQVIRLRQGQAFPHMIAVDDTHVFWTNGGQDLGNGTVMRANKDGSGQDTLAANALKPRGLALDDTHVFWVDSEDGSLHRVAKDAMSNDQVLVPAVVTMSNSNEGGVLIDGDTVYWTHVGTGSIFSADKNDGSNAVTLISGESYPTHMALDGGFLYFTGRVQGMSRLPLGGGPVEPLVSPQPSIGYSFGVVAADGLITFRETDWGAGEEGRLTQFDPASDTFEILASCFEANALAVDDTHFYWTSSSTGTVSKIAKDGSGQLVLATAQDDPMGIAVDDEAVYWTNRSLGSSTTGSIAKVAK